MIVLKNNGRTGYLMGFIRTVCTLVEIERWILGIYWLIRTGASVDALALGDRPRYLKIL